MADDGFYMLATTERDARAAWRSMDPLTRMEYECDGVKDEVSFVAELTVEAENARSFFRRKTGELVAVMYSLPGDCGTGKGRSCGVVVTDAAKSRGNWRWFVRKSAEMRDAFVATEPKWARFFYVAILSRFARSRAWAEKACGFVPLAVATLGGEHFTLYAYTRKESAE